MTAENAPADGVNSETNPTVDEGLPVAAATAEDQPGQTTETPAEKTPEAQDGKPLAGSEEPEKPRTRRDMRIEQLLHDNQAMRAFADRELARRQEVEQKALFLPRLEDFQTDAPYMQAVADQAVAKAQLALIDKQVAAARCRAADSAEEAWHERTSSFRERVPDFDAVAHNPNLKITPIMSDAIRESDLGAEVAYYLGKNPHEAARIASLPPVSQATAIARLETRVSKTLPSLTKAPAPAATTLKGGNAGGQKRLEDMNFDEYRKARGF